MKIKFVIIILFLSNLSYCYADDLSKKQVIRAMIGEASSEGFEGMKAVCCAILNRGTLKGVYGLKAKHVNSEPAWVWGMAERAYHEANRDIDITKGATHWESVDFPEPYWAKDMVKTVQIGKHVFYKKKEVI